MLRSTNRKPGRPTAHFRTRNGDRIEGLMRLKDGRWRASGPEKFTFTERDEDLAVMRYRQWLDLKQGGQLLRIPVATRHSTSGSTNHIVNTVFHPHVETDLETGTSTRAAYPDAIWLWVRNEILTRPKFVAQMTGIEQIGYLAELVKPQPSPTLREVGELYFSKAKISDHWRVKSRLFWGEFCDSVDVTKLRELTQELVADYKADVLDAPPSPTYVKHRFGQIKTIINYSKQWGKWAEDRTRALGYCAMLIPPSSTTLNPSPIAREHFQVLFEAADASTQAILLLALNCCMYANEVADLRWFDFNFDEGTMVADRGKTGVARVAVLWPRTMEALRKLHKINDHLFVTDATKQPHNANTITKAFRKLRTPVGLDTVKFCHLRDGAYTAAVEAEGIQYEHARVLAGHRLGMSDHYVKRRPKLVSAACAAIQAAYFPM